ncbi:MAG: hypothetical protein R8G34_15760 [Paracoccaceae bacterium]|nr:hypothetical protein [Paracoccaceae bacterium]
MVDLLTGTLESVTDLTLFGGANALAVESPPGIWEIVQAGTADLIAPGRYRLTRLLRGQRGMEAAMANSTPAGVSVVSILNELNHETITIVSCHVGRLPCQTLSKPIQILTVLTDGAEEPSDFVRRQGLYDFARRL